MTRTLTPSAPGARRVAIRSVALCLAVAIVASLTLAAAGKLSWLIFWILAAVGALAASFVNRSSA